MYARCSSKCFSMSLCADPNLPQLSKIQDSDLLIFQIGKNSCVSGRFTAFALAQPRPRLPFSHSHSLSCSRPAFPHPLTIDPLVCVSFVPRAKHILQLERHGSMATLSRLSTIVMKVYLMTELTVTASPLALVEERSSLREP